VDNAGDQLTIGFEGSGDLLKKLKDVKPTFNRVE
jgi:hypothetical protein